MSNKELMDIFGFISVTKIYDAKTFKPRMRFIHKDGSYEDSYTLTIEDIYDNKIDIVNTYLSNKLYLMYEKRNSKIDEILNNLK